ncbi:uncharacterized protein [Centruroides vittatus]|uniref:uncharacterized protein n=1 Tax=Centruroides vittatus TaxID=120091 RepID=UPI0035103EAE
MLQNHIQATQSNTADPSAISNLQARMKRFATSKLAKRMGFHNIVTPAPDTPRMFAFAKTHKPGKELRPVVDKARAPTFLLEKATHKLLIPHLQGYPHTVTNPADLANTLKWLPTPPKFITVLDFKSLYPSIKLPPVFCAIRDTLMNITQDSTLQPDILEMAHLICFNSFFKFNGITYQQQRGVPMGSPVAGDLCELVVRKLESEVISSQRSHILLYQRYIDDILILWKDIPNIRALVDTFNDNPYGLTLELDQAHHTQAHFLDIYITVEESSINTQVYHKPSTEPLYIPAFSCDPPQYKMAAFKALLKRALTHSSSQAAFNSEMQHIKNIAKQHGYHNIARKNNFEALRLLSTHTPPSNGSPPKFIPITYNPALKTIYYQIAKKKDIRLAFRRCPTIFEWLRNGKDAPDKNRLPGIYSIPIADHRDNSEAIYIGSTKRNIQTRIKEHKADILHHRQNTALAVYSSDPEIEPLFTCAAIIHPTFRQDHLKWLEAIYILLNTRSNTHCINFKKEIILSSAWEAFLNRSLT